MLKKALKTTGALLISAVMLAGCKGTPDTSNEGLADQIMSEDAAAAAAANTPKGETLPDVDIHNFISPEPGEKIAVMTIQDYGEIKIKFFPEDAAKGVENFIGLAETGYYDELIFHRIIQDFMNQGGDPKGNGTGGNSMWGEPFEGGTSEHLYHFSGAVAYAHDAYSGTAGNGSQFYIVNTEEGDYSLGGRYLEDGSIYYYQSFEEAGLSLPGNVQEMYREKGGYPGLDGDYTIFGQVFEGMDVIRAIAKVETDANDKPLKPVIIESVRIVEYEG